MSTGFRITQYLDFNLEDLASASDAQREDRVAGIIEGLRTMGFAMGAYQIDEDVTWDQDPEELT